MYFTATLTAQLILVIPSANNATIHVRRQRNMGTPDSGNNIEFSRAGSPQSTQTTTRRVPAEDSTRDLARRWWRPLAQMSAERPGEPHTMPRVSRETLPGERLGLLLRVPCQQTAQGCVAQGAAQGAAHRPRVNPQTARSQLVVEEVAPERQVQGAAGPAHCCGTRHARPFPARGGRWSAPRPPGDAGDRPEHLLV